MNNRKLQHSKRLRCVNKPVHARLPSGYFAVWPLPPNGALLLLLLQQWNIAREFIVEDIPRTIYIKRTLANWTILVKTRFAWETTLIVLLLAPLVIAVYAQKLPYVRGWNTTVKFTGYRITNIGWPIYHEFHTYRTHTHRQTCQQSV